MKQLYTLFFAFFIFSSLSAQQAVIEGKVLDASTKEPLTGVSVAIQNVAGTHSDINGHYKLSLDPGTYKVAFRFIGYTSKEVNVTLQAGETRKLDMSLPEANTELEAVVVSAGRFEQKLEDLTVSMVLIKPALIENKNTTNAETILEQVPGVTVEDGQVSIRGGSGFAYGAGSRVLMMVDELPLLSADAGDIKWNTIPIENLEQIEVIKGASSVLYGSSALNGVINIRTAYPKDKPVTKISLTHGVYGNPKRDSLRWWDTNPYYTGVNFFHGQKFGAFDLVVGGAAFSDKGYREGEVENRGRFNFNTRYRSKKIEGLSFGLNGNFQKSKGGVFIIWQDANNVYRPSGGADPENNPASTLSINYGTRLNLDPHLTYFTKKGGRHSLRTRWYFVDNQNVDNQSSSSNMYYGEYQYSRTFKNELTVTSGVAGYYSTVKAELYGTHYGSNAAVFTQFDKKIGRLNLSAGVRFEYYRIDSTETVSSYRIVRGTDTTTFPVQPVFRAGANYRLFEETYLRTSFGQGYRYPSVAEKYVRTSVGALNIFPNPAIEAETGWSAEFGVKQGLKIGRWMGYLDVAGFWTEYSNMMEFAFGVYNPPGVALNFSPNSPGYILNWTGFRAQNAERARITGIDISLVGKGKIKNSELTVFAGYTYMDPISLNSDSSYVASFSVPGTRMLKYRYKHLAKADVQWDYGRWMAGVSMRYNSFMVNIDRSFEELILPVGNGISLGDRLLPGMREYREEHNKGALVFDVRLAFKLNENARILAIVNNLFNEEYMGRPGDVMPPRTFAMQFALQF